ncbi:ribosome maturation factor RimM [Oceanobacillus halotolerans]|uniref:ribosome maturation factor RimM n=1 Tax=Oceanobacillus halotolerans TaxID=2663380 RepID=UPI00384BFD5D
MFNIGKIVNTHGVRGEVKVLRITDFEDRFNVGNTMYIAKDKDQPIPVEVVSHRIHKGFDLLQFKGIENINDVESFKGAFLKVAEDQLNELEEDAYYYHEIIGSAVYLTNGEELGTIKEILSPGANDVWVVNRKEGKDVLIPYIEDVVKEVDVTNQKVVIEPMEGLLD